MSYWLLILGISLSSVKRRRPWRKHNCITIVISLKLRRTQIEIRIRNASSFFQFGARFIPMQYQLDYYSNTNCKVKKCNSLPTMTQFDTVWLNTSEVLLTAFKVGAVSNAFWLVSLSLLTHQWNHASGQVQPIKKFIPQLITCRSVL